MAVKLITFKEIISTLDNRNNILECVHPPSPCIAVKE